MVSIDPDAGPPSGEDAVLDDDGVPPTPPRPWGPLDEAERSVDAVFDRSEVLRYVRSPADLLRLLGFVAISAVLAALAAGARDTILGFEQDVLRLLAFLPDEVERLLGGVTQIAVSLVFLVVLGIVLASRRYRLFGYLFVGNALSTACVVLAEWLLDRRSPPIIVDEIARRAGASTATYPDTTTVAQVAATFIILSPFVTSRWRKAGAITLAGIVLVRLVLSVHLPVDVFLSLTLGGAAGAAVLLMFGRPDQRPRASSVAAALRAAGLPVGSLDPAPLDTAYLCRLVGGDQLFVKVVSAKDRAADLLFRSYRLLRLKNLGDERPFSSLRNIVEHEALVCLVARDAGVRTPAMRAVVDVGQDSMLMAFDNVEGTQLDRLDNADLSDELLQGVWTQVDLLHGRRIAHRDLRGANVRIDEDGEPWLIGFSYSELAADDGQLNADVAQVLASLALRAGAGRSVDSAIAVLGVDVVAAALPRLQPNALSTATRTAMRHRNGLLKELQAVVAQRGGVDHIEFEDLQRISGKTIFTIVVLVAATYFLLPQFADLPAIAHQVADANWLWALPVAAMAALTFVGAAVSLAGAVPDRLRVGPNLAAQLASAFASKLAPSSVGGMALGVRFLQKSGVDPAVAVSGVGLSVVGGFAVHLTLLALFVVWAGSSAFGSINVPDPTLFLVAAGGVLVAGVVALAIPALRHLLMRRLLPILRRSAGGIGDVMRRPDKLALLIGGSLLVTGGNIVALFIAIQAFGGSLPFAQVGAIYLAGAAVASAAPTPGGLGALEAALIAGLVAAGMENSAAVPSVFLYRLITFWLPVLPGYIALEWMKRADYI